MLNLLHSFLKPLRLQAEIGAIYFPHGNIIGSIPNDC